MTKKILLIGFIITLLLVCIFSSIIVYTLLDFVKISIKEEHSSLNVNAGSDESILIPSVNKSDRIYLILNSSSRINTKVEPTTALTQLPFDIEGIPYEFEDWILEQQRLCFIANESSSSMLQLSFTDPKTPYVAKIFEGNADYTLYKYIDESKENFIGVYVQALTNQTSRFQQVILIYPYNRIAEQNFQINGSLKLISGKIAYVNLIIMTQDRNWLPYNLVPQYNVIESRPRRTINFTVNLHNQTAFGHPFSEDFNKQIQYITINIGLDSSRWLSTDVSHAEVGIGNVSIYNGAEVTAIEPEVFDNYQVNADLYVFLKFHSTAIFTISVLMLILLVFAGALMLARMSGFKFKLQKLFTPLVTTEAVSDPRPNTYLAKLFHKPRYDRLTTLVSEFAGREIGTFIDVGCGKGILQKWLKQNGVHVARYISCDINADDLHENKSMERILCDVQHLPFKPQVAEAVTCSEVLEHVPEPFAGFNEILGISQHWVFLSFPNEKLKNALGFRYSEHISDLSEIELVRLAKEKNLTLFKREKLFFVFPPSVFDKLKLSYTAFYRPLVESVFHQLSIILGGFSLITTALLVFERQETG